MWAALFAAHCKVRMSRSGQETWRERPGRARLQWPRACPEGRSRHQCQCRCRVSVGPVRIKLPHIVQTCRGDQLPIFGKIWYQSSGKPIYWMPGGSPPIESRLAVRKTCLVRRVRKTRGRGPRHDAPAITWSMLDLCSAPCKALRFASTARTRGLRALV